MEPLRGADPAVVGRYRLLSRLGSGGMGVVYLADGPRGRVAIKLVRAELGDNATFRARFRREVQASFRVSSAYTAKLLDFDTEADQPWLATEFVDGPSLDELVTTGGPLSHADQLTLAAGLAQALSAVHAEHLVHRDLKPPNVLMTASGPIVIDFGIAAAADVARLTTEGLMVGSPGWLAPEQIEIGEAVPASDVFAFGLVLCFAASGEQPFGSGSNPALISRALTSTPAVPLDRLAPELRDVVLASVRREPRERPTAEEIADQLSSPQPALTLPARRPTVPETIVQPPKAPTPTVAALTTQAPSPSPAPPKRRRPMIAAVIGALVVAGGAVGLILGLGGSSPSPVASPSSSPSSSPTSSPTPTPTPTPTPSAQQTRLANAATLRAADFPGGIKMSTLAFTLPCQLDFVSFDSNVAQRSVTSSAPPAGDHVHEVVAVLPTQSEAVALFDRIRAQITGCQSETYRNDAGTGSVPAVSLGVGDESIYLVEKSTDRFLVTSIDSFVMVRRGPVIFRLWVGIADRGNRSRTAALAQTLVARIDAAR